MNNMFLSMLEQTFDEYFHTLTDLTPNNLRYNEEYRKELKNFCQFLIEEYNAAQNSENFWSNRIQGE